MSVEFTNGASSIVGTSASNGEKVPARQSMRSVITLAAGTVFGQGLAVLSAPILSRFYSPDDFGILAVYVALTTILTSIATFRYELAIPLPEDDRAASSLVVLSVVLAITFVGIGIALTAPYTDILARALGIQSLSRYSILIWLGVLGGATYTVLSYWALRRERFAVTAQTKVAQGVGQTIVQLAGGAMGFAPMALLLGDVVGRAAGITRLCGGLLGPTNDRLPKWSGSHILAVAKRYKRFPLLLTWATALNAASLQLPAFILVKAFGTHSLGLYALTYRVLALPASVIGQAIGQVLYVRFARIRESPAEVAALTCAAATLLFAVALPPFAALAIAGPSLFSLVFGEEWAQAGYYAQLLAPWFAVWFVSSPLSMLVLVREWQGSSLGITAAEMGLRAVALLTGATLGSATLSIALLSASGVVISLLSIWRFAQAGHTAPSAVFSSMAGVVAVCAPLIAAYAVAHRFTSSLVSIVLGFVMVGICYALLATRLREVRHALK